ncbi:MAG: rubredoxin-like domain-containing protein [Methanohalobium sp.]|uniref:rubredoxin-like domain-containing protein n=1 Tax=Methanohalobium sp. TaxID=2837493 RepID=UPI0039784750
MTINLKEQHVCKVCSYNMVGYLPDRCPFCNAPKEKFITAEKCSRDYDVQETPITDSVTRLSSVPKLGIEHASYQIHTSNKIYQIDCPSSFNTGVNPMDEIIFTHFHFLGASNLYREYFSSNVSIHQSDSDFKLCRGFTFDDIFQTAFKKDGIEGIHIDGHSPGFTCYFFEHVAFICDYVLFRNNRMMFNPYGPQSETIKDGQQLKDLIDKRMIHKICGVNYVMDIEDWYRTPKFT